MPRQSCFWTRKLELELIKFVRTREAIWKPAGNTNHDIQLKYKAYAEFAAMQGKGFTASSVRDRWVNIRSTFHHNLRKVKRAQLSTSGKMYIPCWPLWEPLQFLRDDVKTELKLEPESENPSNHDNMVPAQNQIPNELYIKMDPNLLNVRTNRPRIVKSFKKKKSGSCVKVINKLIDALNPLLNTSSRPRYWYFGKHVTERLDCMRDKDARCASQEIMRLVNDWIRSDEET